jgi:pimeloyl-ACP methyl ester carboxylesterase
MIVRMYQVRRAARSLFVPIRTHSYHVWVWGEPSASLPPLVMVHGWMDVGASYQFVVDALSDAFAQGRQIIAPDWRGYGLTTGPKTDNYWFADYLADLDFLLDHFAGDRPIDLVGHSMGGNVVMHYGAVRPQRIRRLVNIEGFGGPGGQADQAPGRYARWIDEIKAFERGEMNLRPYDSADGVARRLTKTNPRLARDAAGRDKAQWLATQWARENAQGQWDILGDPAHKIIFANLTHADEILAHYRRLTMPVLAVEASDDPMASWWKGKFTKAEYHERLQLLADCRIAVVEDAGHMLHHDQPLALARLLEQFLA